MSRQTIKSRANALAGRLAGRLCPFYRRFPYAGPMPFFKVDPRGAYSPAEPFFYNRVPKAANSTITHTLRRHSTYRRPFAKDDDPKDHFLRPSYLNARDVDRLVGEAFKFTVVRDPYARTLSAFQDKILGHRPQERAFRAWFGSDAPPEFSDFCRYLDDGNLHVDMHWAPQADFLLLPLEMFDFVGRVETLEADLAHVITQLYGADAARGMVQAGKTTGAGDKVASAYGPAEFEIVTRLFARDFETLGYPTRDA